MGVQAGLAHLFRALKAPGAVRALPKLADRARAEESTYERFVQALLETEVAAHAGPQGRFVPAQGQGLRLPPPAKSPEIG